MDKKEKKDNSYLEVIQKFLDEIKFGTVTIIVQDGKIIQVEKNEKFRLKN